MATATDEQVEEKQGEESADDQAAIDAFNEDGRSIDEMAESGEDETPVAPMQIPIPGSIESISSSFGGQKPTSSEMRLLGGKMPIEGQFSKGDTVLLLVEAKVTAVEGVDFTDDWGTIERTARRHKARMISVRRASE